MPIILPPLGRSSSSAAAAAAALAAARRVSRSARVMMSRARCGSQVSVRPPRVRSAFERSGCRVWLRSHLVQRGGETLDLACGDGVLSPGLGDGRSVGCQLGRVENRSDVVDVGPYEVVLARGPDPFARFSVIRRVSRCSISRASGSGGAVGLAVAFVLAVAGAAHGQSAAAQPGPAVELGGVGYRYPAQASGCAGRRAIFRLSGSRGRHRLVRLACGPCLVRPAALGRGRSAVRTWGGVGAHGRRARPRPPEVRPRADR